MEFFGVLAGLLLPWLLGVVWLRARWLNAGQVNWPTLLGYGYLVGAFATGLIIRLLDLMGVHLGFASIALTLAGLIAIAIPMGSKFASGKKTVGTDWKGLRGWEKMVFGFLLAILFLRFIGLGLEVLWRPLFPWDAWSQWASKARVWYEFGRLSPFVLNDTWLSSSGAEVFTDSAPQYPAAISAGIRRGQEPAGIMAGRVMRRVENMGCWRVGLELLRPLVW